jgi:hypothetical protein
MAASVELEEESLDGQAQDDSDGDATWSDRLTVRSQPLYTPIKKSLTRVLLAERTLRSKKKKEKRGWEDVARDTRRKLVRPRRLLPAPSRSPCIETCLRGQRGRNFRWRCGIGAHGVCGAQRRAGGTARERRPRELALPPPPFLLHAISLC